MVFPRRPNDKSKKVQRRRAFLAALAITTVPICAVIGKEARRVERGELVRAVLDGDEKRIRKLLADGADVNENLGTNDRPITPVLVAIATGRAEIAALLAVSAIDLDIRLNYRGWSASDLAGHLHQQDLAELLADSAEDVDSELSEYDPDRAAYVANGLVQLGSQRDLGTAVGLSYITCALRKYGEHSNRDEILEQATRLRDACNQKLARLVDANGLPAAALVAMQNIGDRSLALQVADSINSRQSAQGHFNGTEFAHSLNEQRFFQKSLEEAYVAAKASPNRAAVVDGFAVSKLNAHTHDEARLIVKNNSARFHPAAINLVAYEAALNRPEQTLVYRSWKEVFVDIKDTNLHSQKILQKIEDAEVSAQKAKDLSDKFAVLRGSAYLVAAIAGSRDPALGRQIAGVASGAIQIGQSIATFVAAAAVTAASCCTLVGGIVVGIMAIVSAFSGPTTEEIILQQLQELRQQVEQVRQQMHARFDALDRRLDQLFLGLEVAFNSLNIEVSLARQEIAAVALRLTMVEISLVNLEPNIREYTSVASDRELFRKVGPIIDWAKHNKYRPLPKLLFVDGLNALRQGAKEATDALSTRAALSADEVQNDDLLAKAALSGLVSGRMDSNLAILKSVCWRFDPDALLAKAPLANPLRWAQMSVLYAELAEQYPDQFRKYVTPEGINELARFGEQWRGVTKDFTAGA